MTNLEAKESQELTEKVLNIRYALDKLNDQKQGLEEDVKKLEEKFGTLKAQNEQFDKANKDFEKKLADLNKEIREKEKELASQEAVFKDEITKQFSLIDDEKRALIKREKDVTGRENAVMRDEANNAEKTRSFEATALGLETRERALATRELELKIKNDNFNTFELTLNQKLNGVNEKDAHLTKRENSLKMRESELNTKAEITKRDTEESRMMKLALELDRQNYEKEKTKDMYILRVLSEIQRRCLTNVGEKITKDVVENITKQYLDFLNKAEVITEKQIIEELAMVDIGTPDEIEENIEDGIEKNIEDEIEENINGTDVDSTEDIEGALEETEVPGEAETNVNLEELSQEMLVKVANDMGIKAQKNRKKETIIKKIQSL